MEGLSRWTTCNRRRMNVVVIAYNFVGDALRDAALEKINARLILL